MRPARSGFTVALVVLVTLVLAVSADLCPPAVAEGDETVYGVDETVTLDVNAVGDVEHEYVLAYDTGFFAERGASFEEYPFLLARRYRAQEEVGEIQGLDAALDRDAGEVTLTFREPGRVYNMGDRWVMYGLGASPDEVVDGVVVIREESTENDDFTLWQDMVFTTTTRVALPEGAEHVRWDGDEQALVWQTPEQAAAFRDVGGTVLQRHRALFTAVFVALMAASLVVLVVALLRGRCEKVG